MGDNILEKKEDTELVKVIDDAIANSKDYVEALDKVIKFEKEHRGLKGMHISAPLDVLCGQRKVEDPHGEANKIAHDVLKMRRASALRQLKEVDVTDEVL